MTSRSFWLSYSVEDGLHSFTGAGEGCDLFRVSGEDLERVCDAVGHRLRLAVTPPDPSRVVPLR